MIKPSRFWKRIVALVVVESFCLTTLGIDFVFANATTSHLRTRSVRDGADFRDLRDELKKETTSQDGGRRKVEKDFVKLAKRASQGDLESLNFLMGLADQSGHPTAVRLLQNLDPSGIVDRVKSSEDQATHDMYHHALRVLAEEWSNTAAQRALKALHAYSPKRHFTPPEAAKDGEGKVVYSDQAQRIADRATKKLVEHFGDNLKAVKLIGDSVHFGKWVNAVTLVVVVDHYLQPPEFSESVPIYVTSFTTREVRYELQHISERGYPRPAYPDFHWLFTQDSKILYGKELAARIVEAMRERKKLPDKVLGIKGDTAPASGEARDGSDKIDPEFLQAVDHFVQAEHPGHLDVGSIERALGNEFREERTFQTGLLRYVAKILLPLSSRRRAEKMKLLNPFFHHHLREAVGFTAVEHYLMETHDPPGLFAFLEAEEDLNVVAAALQAVNFADASDAAKSQNVVLAFYAVKEESFQSPIDPDELERLRDGNVHAIDQALYGADPELFDVAATMAEETQRKRFSQELLALSLRRLGFTVPPGALPEREQLYSLESLSWQELKRRFKWIGRGGEWEGDIEKEAAQSRLTFLIQLGRIDEVEDYLAALNRKGIILDRSALWRELNKWRHSPKIDIAKRAQRLLANTSVWFPGTQRFTASDGGTRRDFLRKVFYLSAGMAVPQWFAPALLEVAQGEPISVIGVEHLHPLQIRTAVNTLYNPPMEVSEISNTAYQNAVDEFIRNHGSISQGYEEVLARLKAELDQKKKIAIGVELEEATLAKGVEDAKRNFDFLKNVMQERGVKDPSEKARQALLVLDGPAFYLVAVGKKVDLFPLESSRSKNWERTLLKTLGHVLQELNRIGESGRINPEAFKKWGEFINRILEERTFPKQEEVETILRGFEDPEARRRAREGIAIQMDLLRNAFELEKEMAHAAKAYAEAHPQTTVFVTVGGKHAESVERFLGIEKPSSVKDGGARDRARSQRLTRAAWATAALVGAVSLWGGTEFVLKTLHTRMITQTQQLHQKVYDINSLAALLAALNAGQNPRAEIAIRAPLPGTEKEQVDLLADRLRGLPYDPDNLIFMHALLETVRRLYLDETAMQIIFYFPDREDSKKSLTVQVPMSQDALNRLTSDDGIFSAYAQLLILALEGEERAKRLKQMPPSQDGRTVVAMAKDGASRHDVKILHREVGGKFAVGNITLYVSHLDAPHQEATLWIEHEKGTLAVLLKMDSIDGWNSYSEKLLAEGADGGEYSFKIWLTGIRDGKAHLVVWAPEMVRVSDEAPPTTASRDGGRRWDRRAFLKKVAILTGGLTALQWFGPPLLELAIGQERPTLEELQVTKVKIVAYFRELAKELEREEPARKEAVKFLIDAFEGTGLALSMSLRDPEILRVSGEQGSTGELNVVSVAMNPAAFAALLQASQRTPSFRTLTKAMLIKETGSADEIVLHRRYFEEFRRRMEEYIRGRSKVPPRARLNDPKLLRIARELFANQVIAESTGYVRTYEYLLKKGLGPEALERLETQTESPALKQAIRTVTPPSRHIVRTGQLNKTLLRMDLAMRIIRAVLLGSLREIEPIVRDVVQAEIDEGRLTEEQLRKLLRGQIRFEEIHPQFLKFLTDPSYEFIPRGKESGAVKDGGEKQIEARRVEHLGGRGRGGILKMTPFGGEAWIGAGTFVYRVWVDKGFIHFQRHEKNKKPAEGAMVYIVKWKKPFIVGSRFGDYRIHDSLLQTHHFTLMVNWDDAGLRFYVEDHQTSSGTTVEWNLPESPAPKKAPSQVTAPFAFQKAEAIRKNLVEWAGGEEAYQTRIDLNRPHTKLTLALGALTHELPGLENQELRILAELILRTFFRLENAKRIAKDENPVYPYREDLLKKMIPTEELIPGRMVMMSKSFLGKLSRTEIGDLVTDRHSTELFFLPSDDPSLGNYFASQTLFPWDLANQERRRLYEFVLFLDDEDYAKYTQGDTGTLYGPVQKGWGEVLMIRAKGADIYGMLKVGQGLLLDEVALDPKRLEEPDKFLLQTLTDIPVALPADFERKLDFLTPILIDILKTQV